MRKKIAIVIGTRPEAIKLAPVARELSRRRNFQTIILASGQHRAMLDQALAAFGLRPDFNLNLMRPRQTPNETLSRVIARAAKFFSRHRPDLIVVQGDTTTAAGAALAAFNEKIPVAHVEAGLRTRDFNDPFPEEANRAFIDKISALCFAPTPGARENLLNDGVDLGRIVMTGNTAVDSVEWGLSLIKRREMPLPMKIRAVLTGKRLIVATLHRRESFGAPLQNIARGLIECLRVHPDVVIFYPVHPNPEVRRDARAFFRHPRIVLGEPLGYLEFLALMRRACAIVSDSGGIQEEAAVLHKPLVIAREKTERPEVVAAGIGILAGRTSSAIAAALSGILDDSVLCPRMPAGANPFGDGRAARRIADAVSAYL